MDKQAQNEVLEQMEKTVITLESRLLATSISQSGYIVQSGPGCYVESIINGKVKMTFNVLRAVKMNRAKASKTASLLRDGAGEPLTIISKYAAIKRDLESTRDSLEYFRQAISK